MKTQRLILALFALTVVFGSTIVQNRIRAALSKEIQCQTDFAKSWRGFGAWPSIRFCDQPAGELIFISFGRLREMRLQPSSLPLRA